METLWKTPPLIKVYEAFGAIADGRVDLRGDQSATVASSDKSKRYQVIVADQGREISSNDNASYWQGYLGYPAIAVLIARGFISVPLEVMTPLSGIEWKDLNRRFKDYRKTIAEAERQAVARGGDQIVMRAAAQRVLEALGELRPARGKRTRPP
jgi:hypothetical protein